MVVAILALLAGTAAEPPAQRAVMEVAAQQLVHRLDYPEHAAAKAQEGITAVRLSVDSQGRVVGCAVVSSSGSALLDATTCRILRSRARFRPARDVEGRPVADEVGTEISWVLPTS